MCGVFDAEVEMTDRLQALGYVEVKARKENVLSKAGWTTRGHEFHFSRVTDLNEKDFAYDMVRGRGIADGKDGMIAYGTMASYTHLHFASCPKFVHRFVDNCVKWRMR